MMINLARSAISGVVGAAVLALGIGFAAPAAANGYVYPPMMYSGGAYGQNDNWQNDDWRWRHRHHHYYGYGYDPGGAVALGIIGMIAGAMLSDVARDHGTSYCVRHFRTFKPATGTYTGKDGLEHAC